MLQIAKNCFKALNKSCLFKINISAACYNISHNNLVFQDRRYFFWSKKGSNPQANDENQKQKSEHDSESWKNIGYLIQKMKEENKNKLLLPPQDDKYKGKLTVVLEMDEVLLYVFAPDEHEAYMSAPLTDHDYYIDFKEWGTFLSVYKRPHVKQFLKYLRENCEPILFTTGVKSYVDSVMKLVDPENSFAHIITQEGCNRLTYQEENIDDYVKDLDRLGRDMSKLIYIDSKPFAFWTNPDNGIPVQEYIADSSKQDNELEQLINFIEEIKNEQDVRNVLIEKFEIRRALEESKMC